MRRPLHKIILFIFLLFAIGILNAQTWCASGSEWSYRGHSMGPELGEARYKYLKDTVYHNITCQQLEYTRHPRINNLGIQNLEPWTPYHTSQDTCLYTYSSGDTVFFYYENFNQWLPVYYFDALVGDTIQMVTTPYDTVRKAIVDSTGTIQVDTSQLRWYKFHFINYCEWAHFSGTAIENIGIIDNDLLPFWNCTTDDSYYDLCDFMNDSLSFHNTGGDYFCNMLLSTNDIGNASQLTRTYPNPVSEIFNLIVNQKITTATASIRDISGKIVEHITLQNTHTIIPVYSYPNGSYIITVTSSNGYLASAKLVVLH